MRLTDIPLPWALAGGLLLAGALAAVLVMTHSRKRVEVAAGDGGRPQDPTERAEGRRRRKETLYASFAYLLLFCCAGVAAALSFHGLVGFGRQNLRLSGGWEYLVPFGLDGAAMFSAVIAVREASHGDASFGSRLLVWTFAGAAAWFNWVHAPRGDDHAGAPQFFAGMSLSAAILFDRALKQTRRAALREQGLVPRPLPQIRAVRWLRAPRETFRAWSLMLLEGVRTLDEAVDEVRDERRRADRERHRRKEQEKLDRARVRALSRQHRRWGRARGAVPPVPALVGPAGAADDAPAGAGGLTASARPALRAADEGGPALGTDGPATADGRPPAGARGADHRGVPGTDGAAPAAPEGAAHGGAGRGLDSLEERLAEIERQFG